MGENNEQVIARPAKLSFDEICRELGIGYEDLESLDALAEVPEQTFYQIRLGHPVLQEYAEKVLAALSEHDGKRIWTLDMVEIAIFSPSAPSFASALSTCPMGYETRVGLARRCGVADMVLARMRAGLPVERVDAEKVLAILSLYTDRVWSLTTTFVPLLV